MSIFMILNKLLLISFLISLSSCQKQKTIDNEYDVLIIGAGIGGLSAAAMLSSVYRLKVAVFEAHYRAGCGAFFPNKE